MNRRIFHAGASLSEALRAFARSTTYNSELGLGWRQMRESWQLLAHEARARVFFVALGQSAIGTGAAYVALLLIAYERWHSPWAITLVLLAELVPAMMLGPVFGAAADRWSRKWCTVIADLVRFGAFLGIALVDGIGPTIALALLAGCGTAMFTPAALAALPGLVEPKRLPAATSTYGALVDLGFTAGPALAAVVLVIASPEWLTAANGVTFALSALLLARLPFGEVPAAAPGQRPSLFREARDGLRATVGMTGIRIILLASAAALFFAGLFNVAELPFADDVLGSGDVGYSVLVTVFGAGFIAGSLTGSRGGADRVLKHRYQLGLCVLGVGFVASGVAPVFVIALATFALAGFGNGAVLVYERLLVQATVPDRLAGRVFGVKDALTAWAFGVAFVAAGGLISLLGARELFVAAGIGVLAVWLVSSAALRDEFTGAQVRADKAGAAHPATELSGARADALRAGGA
jgi:MFS family permease